MIKIGEQDAVNVVRYFDDLPDTRSTVNRLHRLGDVIVIAICAIVAFADGPTSIAKWAKLNEMWLKKHLALPNGIPSKDTFRRVLGMIDPESFQQCFHQWLASMASTWDDKKDNKRHVAIDGKTLRRSHDRKNTLGPMHIVSAWASDRGVTLGQVATDEKSNEITAIPELLDRIELDGAVVTIDAAGCQKSIASKIVENKGDYVLALKANQGKLFDDVKLRLGCRLEDDFADCPVSRHVEIERSHGRTEERRYYQITAPSYLHERKKWKGLRTIGAAIRIYEENGVTRSDVRYYISSLRRNGEQFANAVRRHWGVENSLHWCLDVTYREDDSRIRDRRLTENVAWLRRMTLSLIRRHPHKQSNIMKRRMAAWSVDFLMQVLTGKGT